MFQRILLPVDGSLSMTPLVATCLAFAAGLGAAVVAVHVVPPSDATDTVSSPATPAHAGRAVRVQGLDWHRAVAGNRARRTRASH